VPVTLLDMRNLTLLIFISLLISTPLVHAAVYQEEKVKVSVPFGKDYDYARIKVGRVVNGDTLLLENGERVRLIGIDAPENRTGAKATRDSLRQRKPLSVLLRDGRKAAKFVADLIGEKEVRLEFDAQQKDIDGQLLAYVYVGDIFLNAEIVKQGFAQLLITPPNIKYSDLLQKLYDEAKQNKRGLWQELKKE
jgi:micrococcal nuclease